MKQSFSFSEYSAALQCMRKYKLLVVDKVVVPGLESGDMSFGTGIHAGVNALLEGLDGENVFQMYWEHEGTRELAFSSSKFNHEKLMEIGLQMLSKFKRLHLSKYKMIQGETRLYGEYRGIKLEGTPDAIVLYEGKKTLFDFKTTGYSYAKTKIDTSLQLYLYAYLYYMNSGEWVEQIAYLPFVKSTGGIQGPLVKSLSRNTVYRCLDDMVSYIEAMRGLGSFPRNPNSCHMGSIECPYIETCWRQSDEGETRALGSIGQAIGGESVFPPPL